MGNKATSNARHDMERFCYQLIAGDAGYQIAVLTPLDLAA